MKNRAFTLIELLAVIIILGILMLIAIPSVTSYINNSRKSTYVTTVNELVKGTIAKVNSGDLNMFDTDTTYYVPCTCIKLENGEAKSPYGKFDPAYIVVTFDGDNYHYYFTGKDVQNMGVPVLTSSDVLSKESIVANVDAIDTSVGIEGTSNVYVFSDECNGEGEVGPAGTTVSGGSTPGGSSGTSSNVKTAVQTLLEDNNKVRELYEYDTGYYVFIGTNPGNYVRFSNELWRIVGIYGDQLKIVKYNKNSTNGQRDYQWNSSGTNTWGTSSLCNYLNSTYYDSLSDKNLVDNGTWFVGSVNPRATSNIASTAYNSARSIEWTGKVGLISAYEMYYAADDPVCYGYSWAYFQNIDYLQGYTCDLNWTFELERRYDYDMWLINPSSSSGKALGFNGYNSYISDYYYVTYSKVMIPALFLKSTVKFSGGLGTYEEPYLLKP